MTGTHRPAPFFFLAALGCLYVAFLALDLLRPGSGWSVALKYAAILLCFFKGLGCPRNTDGLLTRWALGFTLAADWFLLVLDRYYWAGVACFCAVQVLYMVRIRRLGGWALGPELILRGLAAAVLLAGAAALGALDGLTALALCYFSQLACNAMAALLLGRRGRLLALGLLFFVGCDLCVGLHNLSPALAVFLPASLFSFAQVGMWLFYLPSQALITLSAGKLCDNA